eukprot:scaffold269_cov404-Prasinococcus_capsulatus_cf.AAC.24
MVDRGRPPQMDRRWCLVVAGGPPRGVDNSAAAEGCNPNSSSRPHGRSDSEFACCSSPAALSTCPPLRVAEPGLAARRVRVHRGVEAPGGRGRTLADSAVTAGDRAAAPQKPPPRAPCGRQAALRGPSCAAVERAAHSLTCCWLSLRARLREISSGGRGRAPSPSKATRGRGKGRLFMRTSPSHQLHLPRPLGRQCGPSPLPARPCSEVSPRGRAYGGRDVLLLTCMRTRRASLPGRTSLGWTSHTDSHQPGPKIWGWHPLTRGSPRQSNGDSVYPIRNRPFSASVTIGQRMINRI